ncbi:MAG: hypothetical protein ACI35W_07490 [Anaeroplasmataceae bacterium]
MKKIKYVLLFIFISLLFVVTSCKSNNSKIQVYLPDGTPALALTNMLNDGFEYDGKEFEFNIVSASDISTYYSSGKADLAIMPTVMAAQLYNKGIDIKMLTNNVFGNLYIVTTMDSNSLESLIGKVIYVTTGTTLQMLTYILSSNNIPYETGDEAVTSKVVISSKESASEIIPLLKQASTKNEEALGVLGEPQVTQAMIKVGEKLKIAVDFQAEYQKIAGGSSYPQASLVGKSSVLSKGLVDKLYEKMSLNVEFINSNVASINSIFEKYDSALSGLTFTTDTIARCNLGLKKACLEKNVINKYVLDLMKITLDDNFYYEF